MTKARCVPARAVLPALVVLGLAALLPAPALAGSCSADGVQPSGAVTRVCMPAPGRWNGDLVVWAHGYVSPEEPVGIPEDQLTLPDGTSLPGILNALGFGFATTSYRKNGLAVVPGVEDVKDAVAAFVAEQGPPRETYLVGASEGGAVTALAVERHPEVFSGGIAACGPIGSFRRQINYWGDFRVLFDAYFPGLIPGSAAFVPQEVRANWETVYEPRIEQAFQARPAALDELLKVSRAPFDAAAPETRVETAKGLLWYSAFATMDGIATLGGQPYDNSWRYYTGSSNDWLLNLRVKRYRADLAAVQEMAANYETTGRLAAPLVTLHTTGDPIVPWWHEPLYSWKTLLGGSALERIDLPVVRYGHCQFEAAEALVALGLLVLEVEGLPLAGAEEVLPTAKARARYRALARSGRGHSPARPAGRSSGRRVP
jgi:pimeloyl-ACP methyl ester carboxylesterase